MVKNKTYLSSNEIKEQEIKKAQNKYLKRKNAFNIIGKVFKYARPYRHYLYLTFLFDLINAVAELLVPIFLGKAIGAAIGPGNVNFRTITFYVLIMIGCIIIAAIFNALGSIAINAYNYKATYKIRDLLFK